MIATTIPIFKNKYDTNSSELTVYITQEIYNEYSYEELDGRVTENIERVNEAIKKEMPKSIKVVINSMGGDVPYGVALCNILMSAGVPIVAEIVGFCASMASMITQMLKKNNHKVYIGSMSQMLFHNVIGWCWGNHIDMQKRSEELKRHSDTFMDLVAENSKQPMEAIKGWFDNEQWLTADECVKNNLVDGYMKLKIPDTVNIKNKKNMTLSDQILNVISNFFAENPNKPPTEANLSNLKETLKENIKAFEAQNTEFKNSIEPTIADLKGNFDKLKNEFEASKNELATQIEALKSKNEAMTENILKITTNSSRPTETRDVFDLGGITAQ